MHKFLVRAASGIIYAAVIVLAIIYGQWTVLALALVFAAIGVCELNHLALGFSKQLLPVYGISVIQVMLFISVFAFTPFISQTWVYILTGLFVILLWPYNALLKRARKTDSQEYAESGANKAPIYGLGYLGIPMALMVVCPLPRLALLVFVLLWINDSGAYIVGSLTGRNKLCPSISPNKTWEGFIGGCVLTMVGALLLDSYCDSFFGMIHIPLWIWIAIGAITCIFGTLGDLLESKIKRFYGVKDSGHWIPGHGGILDRIDSFLLAYPLVFLFLFFLHAY